VQKLPQGFGATFVKGAMDVLRARGASHQSIQAAFVEGVDGVTHRLLGAAEVRGYLRNLISPRTGRKHLGSAQGESIFGAQPTFQSFAFFL